MKRLTYKAAIIHASKSLVQLDQSPVSSYDRKAASKRLSTVSKFLKVHLTPKKTMNSVYDDSFQDWRPQSFPLEDMTNDNMNILLLGYNLICPDFPKQ